ncbi:MAG TPA: hypothetical protein VFT58_07100 [Nitrososphaera sp.]|nr:hypothetical protein [Nitrososphaera sp.]
MDERADESTVVRAAKATQTFSLVHAIGNKERVSARGLSESECKKRKEYLAVSAAMVGGGSVTCLPDSLL